VFVDALGNAVAERSGSQRASTTIYDLASLTKPLVTGMLCARRVEAGEIALDSFISRYLPEFSRTGKQEITLEQLLTHTSVFRHGDRFINSLVHPNKLCLRLLR
jgi:CubicO group peptidase (beta-lactamase class C family)